jgi:hypothetical protein
MNEKPDSSDFNDFGGGAGDFSTKPFYIHDLKVGSADNWAMRCMRFYGLGGTMLFIVQRRAFMFIFLIAERKKNDSGLSLLKYARSCVSCDI